MFSNHFKIIKHIIFKPHATHNSSIRSDEEAEH